MKSIIFIRHGKSSWDYDVADKDRPLKERGITDANNIGVALAKMDLPIDFAFSSPANRALHTAMIVLHTMQANLNDFKVVKNLYDFAGEEVLSFVKSLDNKLETVLLFGHNHAFTHLVNTLGNSNIDNLPTAGMAIITFDVEKWTDLTKGRTEKLIFPKELR
ncbi:histidine phosphatase family protein [Flavobacterium sp. ASW18X]|uniref:SixA phosphatase family protein n=1 Tax=Flavobacterium sp. ASW18X TaxID=2572595 RepID=UPI0010AE4EA8|nr:histidine phosphatase family protein [Flavobacterium sp. ASW18X]TKD63434.1 histidine phosphatase family protein [Flavobacterium sp. ASW18X]